MKHDEARQFHPSPAGYAFSRVVEARGRLVVTAGHVADDETGEICESTDIEDHIRQTFENARKSLALAGASMSDVVRTTYYLTDASHYDVLKKVRADFFREPFPASTGLVVQLLEPDLLFEMDAIAVLPE